MEDYFILFITLIRSLGGEVELSFVDIAEVMSGKYSITMWEDVKTGTVKYKVVEDEDSDSKLKGITLVNE